MKKFVIAAVAAAILATSTVTARANNDGAWFIGGMIGGLVLGEALNNGHRHRPYYREDVYYEKVCQRRWIRVWDDYRGQWKSVRRTKCEWIPVDGY